ncbi:hypothetical protein ACXIT0_12825 [Methylorubrum extorquens]
MPRLAQMIGNQPIGTARIDAASWSPQDTNNVLIGENAVLHFATFDKRSAPEIDDEMTHGPNEAHSFVRHQSIRWCEGAIPIKYEIPMRIRDLAGINACATHLRPRS